MGGLAKYNAAAKEEWREWLWTEINDRLVDRDGVVLYLVGPEDNDGYVAAKLTSLHSCDLIAIDIDPKIISRIRRKHHRISICANLIDVIENWPEHTPIIAVVADFCTGLNKESFRFYRALVHSPGVDPDTTVAVNLLRGRDAASNEWRESMEGIYGKVRNIGWLFKAFEYFHGFYLKHCASRAERRGWEIRGNMSQVIQRIFFSTSPDLPSPVGCAMSEYKSGPQYFDSIVVLWRFNISGAVVEPNQKVRRKISAALAIRTQRKGKRFSGRYATSRGE